LTDLLVTDQLKHLRDRIDAIDDELLRLVNQRAQIAREIGEIKGDGPIYRPEREAQVVRRLQSQNPGPLSGKAVAHLFTEVISACRAIEESLSVAFLGPRGTFSEEAALKHFGGQVRAAPCASIDEVFRQVEAQQVGFGVVPVENSTDGAVGRTLDLLLATPAQICGEVLLPVHQFLMSKAGAIDAVQKIYAHAQSLAQCHEWLNQHLPRSVRVPVVSNAEGARLASEEPSAGSIGSNAAAGLYELNVLAANIEDQPNNTTRFVVIANQEAAPSGRDKTSLAMSVTNRPGAMHDLLAPLAEHGVDMTRFESRPSRTGMWEYVFFVDIKGHQREPHVARALERLREQASFLKILGSYPAAL
jgi:chorismate mutase/prephenate dehydratase